MNEAKANGEAITQARRLMFACFVLKIIAKCRTNNGHWNQQFNHIRSEIDELQGGQSQRNGMANGESRNEYEYFLPIGEGINGTKRDDKQNMVVAVWVGDVVETEA